MKRLIFAVVFVLVGFAAFASDWITWEESDPMTDETQVFFVYSEGGFLDPALVVRFDNGDLDVFINWHDYFADGMNPVMVRFDKRDPMEHQTRLSTDSTATFFRIPAYILTMLLESDTAVFRATPWNESPQTFIVPCAEFRDLFAPYADRFAE